ncbi:diacylglycerol/lipid kinase family protein [Martelella soudanensis]|uniref:diacylglycerol/lipid kinase family protein n=1 Tax=unclassified Martelella TaxID=2629616 RepID=UPI0015DF8140|nr:MULTISPECIES: diacylglycerol kinase family protein [unclassified Martelella]
MRLKGIFNRDGGTFKTTDMDAFHKLATEIFTAAGHEFDCDIVEGKGVKQAIEKTAEGSGFDGMIVGGGDGTVSLAAGFLHGKDKLLGVVPAGTMNLFARSLGISFDIEEALEELANGRPVRVDMPTINDRPFIHQFSAGLHATMIRNREKLDYDSRLGKISASTRAWFDTLRTVPDVRVRYQSDHGDGEGSFALLGVSNNRIHNNAVPFSDRPQGGKLGVYLVKASDFDNMVGFAMDYLTGHLEDSENVTLFEAERITLDFASTDMDQSLDGDLIEVIGHAVIEQHPGALHVIVPADSDLT